ncbi:MAG: GNAT family N-acetyltransferase, partial [Mycobacteriales bacterium]
MNPDRLPLVAELHGKAVGMLRYDRLDGSNRWEVSINLSPAHRGLGLAAPIVRVGHLWLRQRFARATLVAETRASNEAMLRTFARCGYREISRDQAWVELELTL